MATYTYGPTVIPEDFDAEEDAKALRDSMKGLGTSEDIIIELLTRRANFQRQYTALQYKTLFGSELIDDLKSELGGNFESVVVALLTPTSDFLASQIKDAITGAGTSENTLIEIMCPMTNREMTSLTLAYETLYTQSLEDALKSEASGDFLRLLVSLTTANRDESRDVDEDKAREDAQALIDAGENSWGTEESVFLSKLASRSFPQLEATFKAYAEMSGKSIEDSIEGELSGDLREGFLSIAKCVQNSSGYFAEVLYKAMKGAGTDDATLIRVIVTRCELDMKFIKEAFQASYETSLEETIEGDTSGDYKKILLALIKE